jgi:uncharacterized damage-inducible protein DinB
LSKKPDKRLVAVSLSNQPFWQALPHLTQSKIVQIHHSSVGRSSYGCAISGVLMTEKFFYDYLVRSRRDLFTFLGSMPDEAISRDVIPGERFHSIKDLVIHIPIIEDSWLHEDILKDQPVWETSSGFPQDFEKAYHPNDSLEWMLEYWLAVEKSTLAYLEKLEPAMLSSEISMPRETGQEFFTVAEVLWHAMQHEVRHTAQIMLLARQLGFDPPQMDLIRYVGRLEG